MGYREGRIVDHKCEDNGCASCKNKRPFDFPEDILTAVKEGRLVLFAGAGISTENRRCYSSTLFEEIRSELKIPEDSNLSFSKLMSVYCSRPNGRRKLISRIKNRFDYVMSFPELYREATRFHRSLSQIYLIKDIITTNWDDFFERECGAIPYVTGEDFVFWDLPDRRVLKIHGSIQNYGSLVATEEDYKKCYSSLNKGIIGSFLKTLLATKVLVFIGYSFGDDDFNRIQKYLENEMKGLIPHSYIITLDERAQERFENQNLTPIITDGSYFIDTLKQILVNDHTLIDENIFYYVDALLEVVQEIHSQVSEISFHKNPEIIYTLSYQDGLLHAFERILARKKTGEYSHPCHIISFINSYAKLRKEKIRKRAYFDAAYIDGYIEGLMLLVVDEEERGKLSPFYLFGHKGQIKSFNEYLEIIDSGISFHKQARIQAEKLASKSMLETVPHHIPFL